MARQVSAERPSASARASARIESRSSAALASSAIPPGSLSLTVLIRSARRARNAASASHCWRAAAKSISASAAPPAGPLRLRRVYAQPFEPYVLAAPLRRRLHLVAQAVPIRDEPRMQFRRSRQDNPHSEKAPCRRGRVRSQLRLDGAKQAGLVIVRRGVDEHLRPTGAVRHDAPHLGDRPVRDLNDDRAPSRRIP